MNKTQQGVHPDEAELVRLLDGQTIGPEAAAVQEHVAGCEECSLTFDELRHVSNTFKHEIVQDQILIPATIAASPVSRAQPRPWRIAASIVLLLAATSVLQPVRAWMVSGWQTVAGLFTGQNAEEVTGPVTATEVLPTGTIVSFTPRSERLFIDVATWQAAGQLTIVVTEGQSVSAQVLAPEASEHLAIVPSGGISIANSEGSISNYRITVPGGLEEVAVRIAGARIVEFAPVAGQESMVVRLTEG